MIRSLHALILAVTVSVSASAAAQNDESDAYAGSYVKRQAIVVTDMERALSLYRDVLGFELNALTQSSADSYSYDVFNIPRDASIRFATLNAGKTQIRTLALIEVTGTEVAPQSGIRRTAAVINVNGRYEDVLASIDAMGLSRAEPRALGDPDSQRGQGVELGLTDWDGNLVVIYQFPGPQAAPSQR